MSKILSFGKEFMDQNFLKESDKASSKKFPRELLTKRQFFSLVQFERFADDKLKATQKLKFTFGRVENIVGKGDIYQHFLLFPTMFSKGYFLRVVKSLDCVV